MISTMISKFEAARKKFRDSFKRGIKPVDGRQPIPDEIAVAMVQELIELGLPKDALIGVFDAFLILSTHLKEAGYTNIVLLENVHRNLTSAQEKYYDKVKTVCEKSGIKYYVPPMNNYNRCDMKFDAVIGNPPYQNKTEGNRGGSSSNPLWWEFTNIAFNVVKDNGIVSLITPDNIMNGGEQFTSLLIGNKAKYDLKLVDFGADDHFDVGIKICRWVANNAEPTKKAVNNDIIFDPTGVGVIYRCDKLNSILTTLFSYDTDKLNFNTSNRWDKSPITKRVKAEGKDISFANLVTDKSDDYPYAVMNNDKIKFSHYQTKDAGVWRVFVPQFSGETKFFVDDQMGATASTLTHRCNSKEDAEYIKDIVSNPLYVWVIDQLKVSKRISSSIRYLPIAPIEEVLTSEQLSYIQSQLS